MQQVQRNTKLGACIHLQSLGFQPATVIDVGVQQGTPELYAVFPTSLHVLIEPVEEQEPILKKICASLPHASYILAAASDKTGVTNLKVSKNGMYSGMTSDEDQGDANYQIRKISTIALDDLYERSKMPGPILLKIDVDGRETTVLQGAVKLLREKVEYVVIESTAFGQINEVIDFMRDQDFAIYDILDHLYRPLDGALWQVDIAFVKREGRFRTQSSYASETELRRLADE